ncbi:MAG: FAD-dependent oxidoreductase [bacterium]|nr:FAD-dependent oxidoreductase [bacterium]
MAHLGTYDVVIVGGGACGCTTAYFLVNEGLQVALVDKNTVGQEASWASAGMIGPTSAPSANPWYLQTTSLSKSLYDTLNEQLYDETGRWIGYGGDGALTIAMDEREAQSIALEASAQAADGVPAEALTGEEARKREPALPSGVQAALWMPEGRFLDARNYTATIATAARQKGVDIYEGQPVTALQREGDRITGVQCGSDLLSADYVINAAGAWAGKLDPILTFPVRPLHGQIMALEGPPCGLRHNIMRAGAWGYVTPRPDGRVLVGATEDEWGFQKKITADGMALLGVIVRQVLPCLTDCPLLDIWSGLRPASPDGLPAIGPDPRTEGGYLWAAGHTASGMMQMPATAAVLTDLVLGKAPRIPIDQVRINRFLASS